MPCSHSAQYIIHGPGARAQTQWRAGSLRHRKTWQYFQQFFRKSKAKENATYYRAEAVLSGHTAAGHQWQKPRRWMSAYFKPRQLLQVMTPTVVFCIQLTWGRAALRLQDCRTCERAPQSAHLDHLTMWQQGTWRTDFTTTREVCVWAQWSQGLHSLTGLQSEERCHSLLNNLH